MSVDLLFWTAAQNISKETVLHFLDKAAAEFNLEADAIQIKINSITLKHVNTFDAQKIKNAFDSTLKTLINPTVNVFAATTTESFTDKNKIKSLKQLIIHLIQLHKGSRHSLLLTRAEPWPKTKFLSPEENASLGLGRYLFDNWIRKAVTVCKETENSQFFGIGFLDKTPLAVSTDLELIYDHEPDQIPKFTKFAYFHYLRYVIYASAIIAKKNCFAGTSCINPDLEKIPFFDETSTPIFFNDKNKMFPISKVREIKRKNSKKRT